MHSPAFYMVQILGRSSLDSRIGTGHLLQEVEYPDSASASDVVTFAYNAQGQQVYKKDQAGNVLETDLDDGGREEHRRVTTLASGFDGAVRRISTTYDDRGMQATVTQYDNATVGSGTVVDEVVFSYDDWSNLSTFEQDRNSVVSAMGVDYSYAKATTGRNTLRRTGITMPDGTVNTFEYLSANSLHDASASRVTRITRDETVLVAYQYNGLDNVVATRYDQACLSDLTGVGRARRLRKQEKPAP